MKKLLLAAVVAAMATTMVSTAMAAQFPNATCPDTLSIVRLKTLLGTVDPCAPVTGAGTAPGDTVNGVGGIIIGFDTVPTGFDIFIQQTDGGPNSGIDVFTHGTNMKPLYGFNIGDSIVVEYARVANFQGDIEVMSPNNNFSAPNIILSKRSSGNPLPPIFEGNSTDFRETPTNTYFKPYVSALMKLNGPVRVARIILGNAPTFTPLAALVVSDLAPSDSVYIDYIKLMNSAPPAVGTYLTSVTGIGNSATRGYRIMPRSGDDIVDANPPTVTDAYPIADDQYRVVFDRAVTAGSATNPANYNLGSFGSVDAAVMDGTSAAVLTVSGVGLSHGNLETVTTNGITGVANGLTMTNPVGKTFLFGSLSCGEMSAPDPDSLLGIPCRDRSKYAGSSGQYINGGFGQRSTLNGIVVGIYGNLYYMEDANPLSPANNHRGITVFAPPTALTLGHKYTIAGAAQEYWSENEFAAIVYVRDDGAPGVPAAIPLTVGVASYDTCDANQNIDSGRDYLSELVTLQNVKVVQRYTTPTTTGFHVVGPTSTYADTIYVENQNNVLGAYVANNPNYPALGSLVTVTGVMHYTTQTSTPSFRVCPRNAGDIVIHGLTGVTPTDAGLRFAAFPNPARTVNLAFTLPQQTHVELAVYDLFGRRLATLANGPMTAGAHQIAWSGRDDAGNQVHSGVYFYRLKAGNDVRSARTMYIGN